MRSWRGRRGLAIQRRLQNAGPKGADEALRQQTAMGTYLPARTFTERSPRQGPRLAGTALDEGPPGTARAPRKTGQTPN